MGVPHNAPEPHDSHQGPQDNPHNRITPCAVRTAIGRQRFRLSPRSPVQQDMAAAPRSPAARNAPPEAMSIGCPSGHPATEGAPAPAAGRGAAGQPPGPRGPAGPGGGGVPAGAGHNGRGLARAQPAVVAAAAAASRCTGVAAGPNGPGRTGTGGPPRSHGRSADRLGPRRRLPREIVRQPGGILVRRQRKTPSAAASVHFFVAPRWVTLKEVNRCNG